MQERENNLGPTIFPRTVKPVMPDHIRLQEVLAELGRAERHLYRRHRIRLRVDKVTPDGRRALCSAAQVRRRFLRADRTSYEVVESCHEALEPLRIIGVMPLIGWLPRQKSNAFMKIDPKDPFRLLWALGRIRAEQVLRSPDRTILGEERLEPMVQVVTHYDPEQALDGTARNGVGQ